jgi:predicted DNA-binding transcriptional regulator YafY
MDFLLDPELKDGLEGKVALDPMLRTSGNTTLARLTGIFPKMYLGRLSLAIRERRLVRFDYRKPRDTESSLREVEPMDLFEWNGMPYLQAREPSKHPGRIKRFSLSRMHDLEILERRFKRTSRKQIPSCLGAFSGEIFEAVFLADGAHAPYVRERKWHPSQHNRDLPDGGIEFTLPFGDPGEATRWILGHGPGYRPVAPPELVDKWRECIQELSISAASATTNRRRAHQTAKAARC